jgi:hypothetical protein
MDVQVAVVLFVAERRDDLTSAVLRNNAGSRLLDH